MTNRKFVWGLISFLAVVGHLAFSGNHVNGLTEQFNLFYDQDEQRIRERLDGYKKMGVQILRLHAGIPQLEKKQVYLKVLEDYDFRIRMILYAHPHLGFTGENGNRSKNTENFWHPDCERQLMQRNRRVLALLKRLPIWDKVDYVIPMMGPAGELTYPPTWTTKLPKQTFWCYGPHAQADFRNKMREKFQDLGRANKRWGTSFDRWDQVKVLKPGARPGLYWHDVLTWYRDSKRNFARWHVGEMKKLTNKRIILYIPGEHYTKAHWQRAVETGGKHASGSLKTMLDSEFIVELAVETDCDLQYTGLSRAESFNISTWAKTHGFKGKIFGENAGEYGPASRPVDLARIIVESGFDGIDYTASAHLFEPDLRTPNVLHRELGDAFRILGGDEPPKRWTKHPVGVTGPDESVWTYLAEPGERSGLHAMHADGALPAVVRLGRKGWRIEAKKREKSYLYFVLQHPNMGMGKSPRLAMELTYFDEGTGSVEIQYDSKDQTVRKVAGKAGAFKVHANKLELKNTGIWKVHRLIIEDAELSNRCSVRDFRLAVNGPAPFLVESVSLSLL